MVRAKPPAPLLAKPPRLVIRLAPFSVAPPTEVPVKVVAVITPLTWAIAPVAFRFTMGALRLVFSVSEPPLVVARVTVPVAP